jgi:DNA ligase-1
VLLEEVVEASLKLTETSGRLAKISTLAACLARMSADECEIGVRFLTGELRQGRIGIGYARLTELRGGSAAEASVLSLLDVDGAFELVAHTSGSGSMAARSRLLADLMARSTAREQEFLQRLLIGEIRQGALEGVMLDAMARAWNASPSAVRRAVMLSGDIGNVARVLATAGASGLGQFHLELFRPVQPMLAQSADNVADALANFSRAAAEYKLDGARVQVHRVGSDVRIFTRQLNDVTARAPEIVASVLALPVRSIVLDGEAVVRRADGRPEAFQTTMKRFGRRSDVERLKSELPLSSEFFDCLHLDGEDLIDRPAEERIAASDEILPGALRIPRTLVSSRAEAAPFFASALEAGYEGIMIKALDASYEAGRRGASWLKVKRTHTLDLVVLAAEWGSGRRKGSLSNLHLGARDPQGGSPIMLGKTFKGLTDELLSWQTERFLQIETARDAYTVYVRPEVVVEIAFDGVQASSHYPSGLTLRFARVKRYRPDKSAADADSLDAVRLIYEAQNR